MGIVLRMSVFSTHQVWSFKMRHFRWCLEIENMASEEKELTSVALKCFRPFCGPSEDPHTTVISSSHESIFRKSKMNPQNRGDSLDPKSGSVYASL